MTHKAVLKLRIWFATCWFSFCIQTDCGPAFRNEWSRRKSNSDCEITAEKAWSDVPAPVVWTPLQHQYERITRAMCGYAMSRFLGEVPNSLNPCFDWEFTMSQSQKMKERLFLKNISFSFFHFIALFLMLIKGNSWSGITENKCIYNSNSVMHIPSVS